MFRRSTIELAVPKGENRRNENSLMAAACTGFDPVEEQLQKEERLNRLIFEGHGKIEVKNG
jgi:hypothetical protein